MAISIELENDIKYVGNIIKNIFFMFKGIISFYTPKCKIMEVRKNFIREQFKSIFLGVI